MFIVDSCIVVCVYDISVDIREGKVWNQIIQCLMM